MGFPRLTTLMGAISADISLARKENYVFEEAKDVFF